MQNRKDVLDRMNILEKAEIIKIIAEEIKDEEKKAGKSISMYKSYSMASNELKKMQSG